MCSCCNGTIATSSYCRLSAIEQDRILINKNGYHQIASIAESKVERIRLTNDQIQ